MLRPMHTGVALALCALGLAAAPAEAGVWDYITSFQPGVALESSTTTTTLTYDAPVQPGVGWGKGCAPAPGSTQQMQCTVSLSSSSSIPFSVFLQQRFKRTGWLYFDKDIGFSLYSNDASYNAPTGVAAINAGTQQPLEEARVHLYGGIAKGYLTFGVTPPRILPDLLLSIGIGGEATGGNLEVDGQRQNVAMDSSSFYAAGEVVWLRFWKNGALSTAIVADAGNPSRQLSNKVVDGLSDFRLTPSQSTLQILKLVFSGWP